ncbi:MAG: 30S ribosomal protein S5 [archaeon]
MGEKNIGQFNKGKFREEDRKAALAKREEERRKDEVASWQPKTKIGKLVKSKQIIDLDEVIEKYKILESEIVEFLIKPKSDLLLIGQSKGKFGGGKRRIWRQTQRKSAEGNIPTFASMAVIGDEEGHVGIGYGRAKETLPSRNKALRNAKLNIIKVQRGCGSFDCSCNEPHSIPFIVEGKCGSSRIKLLPAPQGTGLVVGDEIKKILKLAGIKDVYSQTFGQTKTTINLAKATIEALKKTNEFIKK